MLRNFQCNDCGASLRQLADRFDDPPEPCGCGSVNLTRRVAGPAHKVVEKLDNGAMARPAERLADGERLAFQRSRPGPPIE